jgi:hypothetical protein
LRNDGRRELRQGVGKRKRSVTRRLKRRTGKNVDIVIGRREKMERKDIDIDIIIVIVELKTGKTRNDVGNAARRNHVVSEMKLPNELYRKLLPHNL